MLGLALAAQSSRILTAFVVALSISLLWLAETGRLAAAAVDERQEVMMWQTGGRWKCSGNQREVG